jgi:N-methylhydantoinase B
MTHDGPDPIVVGLVSSRLASILNEQQTALVNTAFSSVVRESLDLACAVFDSRGEMIGQSVGGTPGHINSMATGMHHFVQAYGPGELEAGDVLITNDPWQTAGQINDITVATPVFKNGRLVAWFASCCHSPDIGGRLLSAEAAEVYEEGLRIAITKLLRRGEPNDELLRIVRANVRTPDETVGDMWAQVAGNAVGSRSLLQLMDEIGLSSIDEVAAEIMTRSETAMRDAIRSLPPCTLTAESATDGFGGESVRLCVTVEIQDSDVIIDFAGSSPQSRYGINVVLNYARAYAAFAIKAAIAPDVPHNAGSFRPVTVKAPLGSILNCEPPAPVASRHLVGHCLPSLLFAALRPVLPGRLLAGSADALWMTVWKGKATDESQYILNLFQAGGSGGRAIKDGLSATGFPTGVRAVPTEVVEVLTPLVQHRRELRADSGGAGRFRGGLGQITEMSNRAASPWTVNGNVDRVHNPAPGAEGGSPGAPGTFGTGTDDDLPMKSLVYLQPDAVVRVRLPGGGGYGHPHERSLEAVLRDVVDGYVSIEQSERQYGVAVRFIGDPESLVRLPVDYEIDDVRTAELRSSGRQE